MPKRSFLDYMTDNWGFIGALLMSAGLSLSSLLYWDEEGSQYALIGFGALFFVILGAGIINWKQRG